MSKSAFFGSNLTHKSYLQILTSKMHILAQKKLFCRIGIIINMCYGYSHYFCRKGGSIMFNHGKKFTKVALMLCGLVALVSPLISQQCQILWYQEKEPDGMDDFSRTFFKSR